MMLDKQQLDVDRRTVSVKVNPCLIGVMMLSGGGVWWQHIDMLLWVG